MTLEELKAAWEKAQADLAKSPEDEGLIKAEADAKAAYEAKKAEAEDDDLEDDVDETKLDDKTKAYIAKLRKENAGHRTKNKDLKSKLNMSEAQKKKMLEAAGLLDEEKPEEKLKSATEQNDSLAFRNAVLETAVANGIPANKIKYFQFLMSEAVSELGEGEELSEERLAEIVKECKAGAQKTPANSTVKKLDKDGNQIQDPPPGEKGEVTLEKFLAMGVVSRSKLYLEKPALYEELAAKAKSKGKLI